MLNSPHVFKNKKITVWVSNHNKIKLWRQYTKNNFDNKKDDFLVVFSILLN